MAATALFGSGWQEDTRNRIVYCGIDAEAFARRQDTSAEVMRPAGSTRELLIGHVGRFAEQKNHAFLLEVAAAVLQREPSARLLLIGDGPLRAQVAERAAQLRIADRVTFAGHRADVAGLLGQMDVFVLPSLFEGLPFVGLEA